MRVGLEKIDFPLVYARYWTDDDYYEQCRKKSIKCAEILVPYSIPFDYVKKCSDGIVKIGTPYVFNNGDGMKILNFPTKDYWRSPSRLSFIVEGLDWFVENYEKCGITSIAFPPFGCGNGGLEWEVVGLVMY